MSPSFIPYKTNRTLETAFRWKRRFTFLKFFMMGGAGICLFLLFLWPYLFKGTERLVDAPYPENIQIETEKKQMLNPRFEGEDAQRQPFVIEANLATQTTEDQIDLVQPKGTLEMGASPEKRMIIKSNMGVLKNQNAHLELQGDVTLEHNGCISHTETAEANLKTKEAFGHAPITTYCQQGSIVSQKGFTVDPEGVVKFYGRPHLTLSNAKGTSL
jgi:hypothetical protein